MLQEALAASPLPAEALSVDVLNEFLPSRAAFSSALGGSGRLSEGCSWHPRRDGIGMAHLRAVNGLVLLACLLGSTAHARAEEGEKRQAGFYLVAAEAETSAALPAASSGQRVVRYDYKT